VDAVSELLDARGVAIAPGDTAIYGFGVGRSVAMAEAVVLEDPKGDPDTDGWGRRVSLTPSGRVRLRVVRRSYGGGEKPVVDVAPDRLVVLKTDVYQGALLPLTVLPTLPPSPLPTQDEANREQIEAMIEVFTGDLRATEVPDRHYYDGWTLARFHAKAAEQLAELRKKLKALDD
jgi:hypothetical protein